MRCVAISDTHSMHRAIQVPDGDVFLHAGDFTGRGTYAETVDFLDWVAELPHAHKVVIPGNHDGWVESAVGRAQSLADERGVRLLIDELTDCDGLRIFGSPYTPEFCNWHFMYPRDQRIRWDEAQMAAADIWLTHGPPHGIGDLVHGRHTGCMSLAYVAWCHGPRYHVFGHIHEGRGRYKSDAIPTVFLNVASWAHWDDETRGCVVFDA